MPADGDIAEENIRNAMKALAKKEKDTVLEEWKEYRSFADGHTDEIRGAYSSTGFETVENVNFDVPFVMTVGRYNSTGSWAEMGNAFFDWSIKPSIESGKSIAGGVSYHYMGSGPEVEVWLCYKSLIDFAEAVSTASNDSSTAKSRKQFWDLAEAQHEDQIYLHIGHVMSICLNFGVAAETGGRTFLRFDDTNPGKEREEAAKARVDEALESCEEQLLLMQQQAEHQRSEAEQAQELSVRLVSFD